MTKCQKKKKGAAHSITTAWDSALDVLQPIVGDRTIVLVRIADEVFGMFCCLPRAEAQLKPVPQTRNREFPFERW